MDDMDVVVFDNNRKKRWGIAAEKECEGLLFWSWMWSADR